MKEKRNKKNILVTGASGHFGKSLLGRITNEGNRVFVIDNKEQDDPISNVKYLLADISSKDSLRKHKNILGKIDVTIHLAAYVPLNRSLDDLEKSLSVNIIGSINLASFLPRDSYLVYINTCEIYNPHTFYAASKISAENLLSVICEKKGIKFTSLRFASIYGPGEKIQRAIPNFINAAIRDEDLVIFGDGKEKRSYLYIDDAVEAVIKAVIRQKEGIFDIASGEAISILSLARLIKEISHSKSDIVFKGRKKEKKDMFFYSKDAEEKLNFKSRIDLKTGIEKEIRYFEKKKPIILFDLDGTILDVSERIYKVYADILNAHNRMALGKREYLVLKRNKVPIADILKRTGANDILGIFQKEWLQNIEKIKYLNLDKVNHLKMRFLNALRKKYNLVLISSRREKELLSKQLKKEKMDIIFSSVIAGTDNRDKLNILGRMDGQKLFIVGDTEEPIIIGKNSGIKTVAVSDGLREEGLLRSLSPDLLIKNIIGLRKYV